MVETRDVRNAAKRAQAELQKPVLAGGDAVAQAEQVLKRNRGPQVFVDAKRILQEHGWLQPERKKVISESVGAVKEEMKHTGDREVLKMELVGPKWASELDKRVRTQLELKAQAKVGTKSEKTEAKRVLAELRKRKEGVSGAVESAWMRRQIAETAATHEQQTLRAGVEALRDDIKNLDKPDVPSASGREVLARLNALNGQADRVKITQDYAMDSLVRVAGKIRNKGNADKVERQMRTHVKSEKLQIMGKQPRLMADKQLFSHEAITTELDRMLAEKTLRGDDAFDPSFQPDKTRKALMKAMGVKEVKEKDAKTHLEVTGDNSVMKWWLKTADTRQASAKCLKDNADQTDPDYALATWKRAKDYVESHEAWMLAKTKVDATLISVSEKHQTDIARSVTKKSGVAAAIDAVHHLDVRSALDDVKNFWDEKWNGARDGAHKLRSDFSRRAGEFRKSLASRVEVKPNPADIQAAMSERDEKIADLQAQVGDLKARIDVLTGKAPAPKASVESPYERAVKMAETIKNAQPVQEPENPYDARVRMAEMIKEATTNPFMPSESDVIPEMPTEKTAGLKVTLDSLIGDFKHTMDLYQRGKTSIYDAQTRVRGYVESLSALAAGNALKEEAMKVLEQIENDPRWDKQKAKSQTYSDYVKSQAQVLGEQTQNIENAKRDVDNGSGI